MFPLIQIHAIKLRNYKILDKIMPDSYKSNQATQSYAEGDTVYINEDVESVEEFEFYSSNINLADTSVAAPASADPIRAEEARTPSSPSNRKRKSTPKGMQELQNITTKKYPNAKWEPESETDRNWVQILHDLSFDEEQEKWVNASALKALENGISGHSALIFFIAGLSLENLMKFQENYNIDFVKEALSKLDLQPEERELWDGVNWNLSGGKLRRLEREPAKDEAGPVKLSDYNNDQPAKKPKFVTVRKAITVADIVGKLSNFIPEKSADAKPEYYGLGYDKNKTAIDNGESSVSDSTKRWISFIPAKSADAGLVDHAEEAAESGYDTVTDDEDTDIGEPSCILYHVAAEVESVVSPSGKLPIS
jgi:hypothetical protein